MKKIVLVCSIIISLASCANKDTTTPSATIDGMVAAMKNGNIEEMKKFISKTDVALFESAEQLMKNVNPEGVQRMKDSVTASFKENVKDVKYTLKNEKINGSTATVDAEVTNEGKTETHTINLLKEDGAWKVSLMNSQGGMFNSMKGNMGTDGPANMQEGLERLKNMPPDSLKKLMDKGLQMLDSMNKQH
jgi:hypothetical protein